MDIQHAVIRNHRKQTYKKNQRAYYDCTEGYRGNPTRTCGENGWIGDSECTGKKVQENKFVVHTICCLFTSKNTKQSLKFTLLGKALPNIVTSHNSEA